MPNIFETIDAAANTSTAYTLQIGQIAQGQLSTLGDHDFYRVNLVAGHTYTIALVGTGGSGVRDTYLRIYGSDGATLIAENDDGLPNNNSIITFTATATGTFYLDAAAYNNGGTGQYGISIAEGTRATTDVQMGAGIIDASDPSTEYSWSATPGTGATVTVGFRMTDDGEQLGFSQFTAQQMAAVQTILGYYSSICGINFTIVNPGGYTDNATILLSNYNHSDGSGAYAYYPGSTAANAQAGDVHVNLAGGSSTSSLPWGSYSFYTLLHELGHSMGLSHPGLYNAGPGVSITYANNAQMTQDTQQYSVMSYFAASNSGANWGSLYAQTLMMYDIYALQQIYGVNYSTRSGDSVYGFNSNVGGVYDFSTNSTPALCIWDGGGIDTLNCSGYGGSQLINLNDGTFSDVLGLTHNVSIALNAVIENAVGGSGSDTFIGSEVNNTFRGGGGTDTIDGGGGRDVTIFNFASTLATIVHNANGSWTISGPGQTETLTNVELATFTDRSIALREPTRQDFNGDGTGDILWRHSDGTVGTWSMNDHQVLSSGSLGVVSADWHIAGTGDFNGDGRSDILWRNDNGSVGTWNLDGQQILSNGGLGLVSTDWQIVGVGDLNGDGLSDILWRNATTGSVGSWDMNNRQIVSNAAISQVSNDWHVVGLGDFNGDGRSDILWWNDDGRVGTWDMNDRQILSNGGLGQVSTDWHILGTGDFNGDGRSDILWRNNDGRLGIWDMNDRQILNSGGIGQVSLDWTVDGIRDVNNDGMSDIIWRNADGRVGIWTMNDHQIVNSNGLGIVDGNWHIVA